MITGNKGEWSEIYALFKLLAEGLFYAGDDNLQKINHLYYPVLHIIRNEKIDEKIDKKISKKIREYTYHCNSSDEIITIYEGSDLLLTVPMNTFRENARLLYSHIITSSGKPSFPDIERFMSSIRCYTLKAKSSDKADIRIKVHDIRTAMSPTLGFSIKSELGKPSTLLNASGSTNIVYKIRGTFSDEEITNINSCEKISERLSRIVGLDYYQVDKQQFEENLMVIDSYLPRILGECIKEYYLTGENLIENVVEAISNRNPLSVRNKDVFYKCKIQSLLVDTALGMVPSKEWKKEYDANGGYLIVRKDGEVLCYPFYDINQTGRYLYKHTKFETASTTKHKFGKIYKENDEFFIKLSVQIRFV